MSPPERANLSESQENGLLEEHDEGSASLDRELHNLPENPGQALPGPPGEHHRERRDEGRPALDGCYRGLPRTLHQGRGWLLLHSVISLLDVEDTQVTSHAIT